VSEDGQHDIGLEQRRHVAIVTLRRPPHNFFDQPLLGRLGGLLEDLDTTDDCRAIVLASEGSAFCAGANQQARVDGTAIQPSALTPHIYDEAVRLFRTRKPIVAAVHGAAIGGGLGLALVADFRVTCAEARLAVTFSRLGVHCGFGLSVTLPRIVGEQAAALLLLTGRRIGGEEALRIGLADILVAQDQVLARSIELAEELAISSPIAVASMRHTLRRGLADRVQAATERERVEQAWQHRTEDYVEGVRAMNERREPLFVGR
jgi:enoyl-CoA hydratase/carnithine racemase